MVTIRSLLTEDNRKLLDKRLLNGDIVIWSLSIVKGMTCSDVQLTG